jgi:hypothetical protein
VLRRIRVIDSSMTGLAPTTPEGLLGILSKLAGEDVRLDCLRGDRASCSERDELGACRTCIAYAQLAKLRGDWTLAKLNQALLLAEQPPVSVDFYTEFFGAVPLSDADFIDSIVQVRAYAMLATGSFRFAFKSLGVSSTRKIREILGAWAVAPSEWKAFYSERMHGTTLVEPIANEDRWFIGYLSARQLQEDFHIEGLIRRAIDGDTLDADEQRIVQGIGPLPGKGELDELRTQLDSLQSRLLASRQTAIANTLAYLAANHIDVYVATSMRERWEFEAAAELIRTVFDATRLKDELALTHFDPTLSYTVDRIDKGLIEGLMLRRARCTLYMAQEFDTLGKDSELAATLAMGRTVIAYVPAVSERILESAYAKAPLALVMKQVLTLLADGKFHLEEIPIAFAALAKLVGYTPAFDLVGGDEAAFRHDNAAVLDSFYPVLAKAHRRFLESRAATLKTAHPLALQLQLETGIANGVLVARSPQQCVELLYAALTGDLEFTIREGAFATVLEEKVSGCPFRVVTKDDALTNAFWTLYLKQEDAPRSFS